MLIGVAGDQTLDTRGRQSDQSWCLVDVSVVAKVMSGVEIGLIRLSGLSKKIAGQVVFPTVVIRRTSR